MWNISKEFEFDFGHRVWSQTLDPVRSLDNSCKCRFLHGHRGKIIVSLSGNKLKDGMITDFKHLNVFKKFIDDIIDHKFIWDLNDPLVATECSDIKSYNNVYFNDGVTIKYITPVIPNHLSSALKEKYEGFVLVPFVPTAENFSSWYYKILQEMLPDLHIASVEFYETPKASSIYYED